MESEDELNIKIQTLISLTNNISKFFEKNQDVNKEDFLADYKSYNLLKNDLIMKKQLLKYFKQKNCIDFKEYLTSIKKKLTACTSETII